MARRKLTVDRHEEIKRRLADGRGLREIARALGCSRRTVREVRDGERLSPETAASPDPLWMAQLEWPAIIHDLGLGHPMKFLWEEKAKAAHHVPELLEAVLPQVPAVPRGDRHGARVRARRAGRSRLRRRSDRVDRAQDGGDPQSLRSLSQGSASASCCLPGRPRI